MPTCLTCNCHYKLNKLLQADDPDNKYCSDCASSFSVDDTFGYSQEDAIDIQGLLNPTGKTPARYSE